MFIIKKRFFVLSYLLIFILFSCDFKDKVNKDLPKSIDAIENISDAYSEAVEGMEEVYTDLQYKDDYYEEDYYQEEKADGIYKYETSEGSFRITISGDSWRSEYIIFTGFGAAYDRQNAQYDSGIFYNGSLYDDSGYLQLGTCSNGRVDFSGVTLYK